MANHPCVKNQREQSTPAPFPGIPVFTEPEVRRWPHPVDGISPADIRPSASAGQTDASLYYIHCALSDQNRLLAEIKSLLEQITAFCSKTADKK